MRKLSIVVMAIIMVATTIGMASAVPTSGVDSFSIGGATSGEHYQNADVASNAINVFGVGGLQLDIGYDHNVLSANSVTIGSGLRGWLYTTSTSKGITVKNGKAITVNFDEKQDKKTQH